MQFPLRPVRLSRLLEGPTATCAVGPSACVLCVALVLFLAARAPIAYAQEASASVAGCVTDALTDAALARVNVRFVRRLADGAGGRGAEAAGTSTNAQGCYRLARLAPGAGTLVVSRVGYATATRAVRLAPGEARTLDLALDPATMHLGEVVVRSRTQRAATSGGGASTVHRVTPATLERTDPVSVADLGRLLPAARVQTNSRGEALLYLRNAGERQVALFFDGALLNVPWDNRVDLSLVPAAALDGITVAQGVPSVRYGTNVLGGAANLVPHDLDRPGQVTRVRLSGATPEAGAASVSHLARRGGAQLGVTAGLASQGDVAVPEGARVPFSQPDPARRTNTDRRLAHVLVRGTLDLGGSSENGPGARLGLTALHVDGRKGVAPESHLDPTRDRVRYWRYPVWRRSLLIAHGEGAVRQTRLRGSAWLSRHQQTIDQYRSVAYDARSETQDDLNLTAGARLLAERAAPLGDLRLALSGLTSRHAEQTTDTGADGRADVGPNLAFRQHLGSAGVEWEARPTERATLVLGASLDAMATPTTGDKPPRDPLTAYGLTATLDVRPSDALTVTAAAGRKARFPTMRELFGAALGRFRPSPGLRPESSLLSEVGVRLRTRPLTGSATVFLRRTYDTIDQRTLPDGRRQRINLDGSRAVGVEVAGAGAVAPRLRLDGHLTWTHARGFTEDDGTQRLVERPAWLGTLAVLADGPAGLTLVVQPELTAGLHGRNEANALVRLPTALAFNARVVYRSTLGALPGAAIGSVFLHVENVTDEAVYSQLGLPQPGRSVRLGIEVAL